MVQSLLGCAEPRFESLELLCLCAHGLLPVVVIGLVRLQGVTGLETMTYF